METRTDVRPAWLMASGALVISGNAVLIALAHTSVGTASFYRFLLALPLLVPPAFVEWRRHGPQPRRDRLVALAGGVLLAGDMLLWARAIPEIGAGLSTVLVNLQVVLVPLLALVLDREPVTRGYLLALPVTLVGVALAAGVVGGSGVGNDPLLGTLHVGGAALCYAGYLYLLRRGGHTGHPVQQVLYVSIAGAVAALAVGVVWHGIDPTPGWATLGWLLLLAITDQVVGWMLIAAATARLPAHTGAVLLMLVPVGGVALAGVVLAERPTPIQLGGCLLVLAGVYLATRRAR